MDSNRVSVLEGACGIEVLARCSEGFTRFSADHRLAYVLHRLITDNSYREQCLQLHGELFTAADEPEKLHAIIGEVEEWHRQNSRGTLPSASGTEGTPLTDREPPT